MSEPKVLRALYTYSPFFTSGYAGFTQESEHREHAMRRQVGEEVMKLLGRPGKWGEAKVAVRGPMTFRREREAFDPLFPLERWEWVTEMTVMVEMADEV